MVRPSDAGAMRKIAFHLPARWVEWAQHPPLGMSHWDPARKNEGEPEEPRGARPELSNVREFLEELQSSVEDVDLRMECREEKRIAWAGDIEDINAWLERVEECRAGIQEDSAWIYQRLGRILPQSWSKGAECQALLRQAAQDPTRIEQLLRRLLDGIHSHLSYERNSVHLYLDVLAGLHFHSEARMRTVNQDMRNLTV
ncbi:hypothetical protein TI39_contig4380g00002 [Zymoseptoria brevis]|uniref:Uncharacterized protein n=1 Tax=Zymoseptoria brevis TaxID=1047168 RepID=A0A0F4G711_9PEZI|nr:hypothetical protein TI39_contig4380g00002 [Zymoseptoria brevis]